MIRTLALSLIAGLAAFGCTASANLQPAAPPPPLDPAAYLPADAYAVVEARVDRLLASPYAELLLIRLQEQAPQRDVVAGIEILRHTRRVLAGVSERQNRAVLVLQGRYAPGELETYLTEDLRVQTMDVQMRGYKGLAFNGAILLRLDERTYVVGDPLLLKDEDLQRGDRRIRPALFADPTFLHYAEQVGFGERDLAAVAVPSAQTRRQIGNLAMLRAEPMVALASGVNVANGLQSDAFVAFSSPGEADRVAAEIQGTIGGLRSNPIVALMGLRGALDGIQVSTAGERLEARVALDDVLAREMIERFGNLLSTQFLLALEAL